MITAVPPAAPPPPDVPALLAALPQDDTTVALCQAIVKARSSLGEIARLAVGADDKRLVIAQVALAAQKALGG